MKLTQKNGLRILEADEGMTLRKKGDDNAPFSLLIYLGKGDTPENYEEVTLEKAEEIIAEQESAENDSEE